MTKSQFSHTHATNKNDNRETKRKPVEQLQNLWRQSGRSLAVSSPVGGRGFYFYDEKICDRTTDMETTLFISLGKFM